MTLTIGNWVYSGSNYMAQPFGYDERDVRKGQTAHKIRVSVLLTNSEWSGLLDEYDDWRDVRITDDDSLLSNDVGTTINVTASANSVSWSAVPSWFITAPVGEQYGRFVQATVELVNAAEALEVLQAEELKNTEKYYFGTWTIGTTTLDLVQPPETYQDTPNLSLTAGGTSYITGPLTATRLRVIEGDTDATGWSNIQSWVESTIQSEPSAGDWFPIGSPSAKAEARIVNGARTDLYTVSITLGQVK